MKTTLYWAIRWTTAVAALVLLALLLVNTADSTADPGRVAEAVTKTLDMTHMQEGDNRRVNQLYGLNPADYEACILYCSDTHTQARELLIIKLRDQSQQAQVRSAIQARLASQKTTFKGWGTEQLTLLNEHALVDIRGNYVLFVVHEAAANAREAFAGSI